MLALLMEKGQAILIALGFLALYSAVIIGTVYYFVLKGKRVFTKIASQTATQSENIPSEPASMQTEEKTDN